MAITIGARRRVGLPRYLAAIGDSTLNQGGAGVAALTATLVANGWDSAKIWGYARDGKPIGQAITPTYSDDQGYTTIQNMAQARTALGREPDVWVFNVGSNGEHDSANSRTLEQTQTDWVNAVLDDVAAHGSARAYWNGISQQTGYTSSGGSETTRMYWNSIVKPVVQARNFAFWNDWHTYIKSQPGEDAHWVGGVHMDSVGYDWKNTFTATSVGPGGG